jgi:hypothetical protein
MSTSMYQYLMTATTKPIKKMANSHQ